MSLIIIHNFGVGCYFAREYDQAVLYFKNVLELDDNFGAPHYFLYLTYLARGDNEMAIKEFQKMLFKNDELKDMAGVAEKIFKTDGIDGFRQWSIDYMLSKPHQLRENDMAMNYVALGKIDSAFYWIEKQVNKKRNWIKYLNVDPGFDKLRSDPRFDNLLKRMNLIP